MKMIQITLVSLLALSLVACSGTVKTNINTTQTVTTLDSNGNPVTVKTDTVSEVAKPKDIAHEETLASKHEACSSGVVSVTPMSLGLVGIDPMELKSGAAQGKYIDSVILGQALRTNEVLAVALKGDPSTACHEAVAKEALGYYTMEAKRSTNRWSFGKFLAGFAGAYLITDSIVDGMANSGSIGDTNIGEVNVSGNATGGPGGEAAGGTADMAQNVNIGNGTLNSAADGGLNAFGEKPIMGDGNVFEDNDSPNTSLF